jgi:hypothetical protein
MWAPEGVCPLWRNKNIFHYPEIEPTIIQLIVWSLNLLSYFGLPVHSHTLLSGDTETAAVFETGPALARGANGSPEPGSWHIFYLSSSWDSPPPPAPRPPLAPLSIDAIVPHFLQLLHFLFSFSSSFPHFKKWKILSFRNKETSGVGLEGQFFRT